MSVTLSAENFAPTFRRVVSRSVSALALLTIIALAFASSAHGLERLKVNSANPRYFADSSGNTVYLAGSSQNPYNLLNNAGQEFSSYFDSLVELNHNFTRLWAWEQSPWTYGPSGQLEFTPQPYQRTGPGTALDGGLKFDLTRLNQAYFDQLRNRVIAAGERGIYVSVILFEGFSSQRRVRQVNPWLADPFQRRNNINNINADPNGNGRGEEFFSLHDPSLRALQEAFVRKLVDALNDLDNVLYEVSGDTLASSLAWQFHMIDYVKSYQATKPHQHPVGISQFYPRRVQEVMNSNADWIVLSAGDASPATATGNKVIFLEGSPLVFRSSNPDHWVWKTFTRGYNPLYSEFRATDSIIEEKVQVAIGQTNAYAALLPLKTMLPSTTACSTGFCLTNEKSGYLVYLPVGGNVSVDLAPASTGYLPSWFDPAGGRTVTGSVVAGGKQMLASPLRGDTVLQIMPDTRLTSSTSGAAIGLSSARSGNASEISSDRGAEGTVSKPMITPNGGVYSGTVKISMSTATRGATIYYTTNGQTPTILSKRYSGSFTLNSSTLVKAKAFKSNMNASAEASAWFSNSSNSMSGFNYTLGNSGNISVTAGSAASTTITATLSSGASNTVSLAASGLPSGATASFSAASCSATCSSTLTVSTSGSTAPGSYPITVTGTADGAAKTTTFTLSVAAVATVATPAISPNGGNFSDSVSVSITTATAGASIYYTTNGTAPSQSSTLYNGPIAVSSSATLKAKAFKSGFTPSNEASASFTKSSSGSTGLVAHWKFDEGSGTTVTDSSGNNNSGTLTNGPLWSAGRKGNALYFDGADDHVTVLHSNSLNLSGAFTLSAWVNPADAFSDFRSVLVKNYKYYLYASVAGYCGDGRPLAGFDAAAAQVACDDSPLTTNTWTHLVLVGNGATLTLYRDGIAVANSNVSGAPSSGTGALQIGASQWGEYFKGLIDEVRVYNRALIDSEVQAIYALEAVDPSAAVATPIVSPAGATFNGPVTVTFQTATSGASIRYTTDGSTPSQSSTLYTAPIAVTSSATVKAKAFKAGLSPSTEASASFTIVQPFGFSLANSGNKSVVAGSSVTNSLSASLGSGSSQPVSFSVSGLPAGAAATFSSTSCSPTCAPLLTITTTASTPAGDFPINVTASGGGVTRNTAFTLSVTLALTVATPTITPNGGSFSSSASVTIQTATSGAAIYYTTDGLAPSQSSNLYTGSFSVTSDTTIKAKAFKSGQNGSAVASASFSVTNTTGNTYYVSTSGSDSSSCTAARNIATPKRSISQALSCLSAGDTLYIRGGTYDEQIQDRTTFGTATRPITIAGYPGDARPVVRPGPSTGNTSLSVWWVAYGDRVSRFLTIKGIELDQGQQGPQYTAGCITIHGPDVTLDNVILRNCGRDGVGIKSKRITVRNSQIYNCGVHNPGLPNTDTKGLGFYANTDTLEQGDSRFAPGFGGEFIFENNIVDGCRGGGGVIHYMGTDNGIVRNNIFRNFGLSSPLSTTKPVGGGFQTTATGVNIGGDGVFGSPGPRNNRIYNNLFINITGDTLASGHKLWGAQDNHIYNNTYYNVHYAYVVLCQSGNYSYAIRSNIWSNVHHQVNDTSTCGGELTATISNNLLNPSVSSTFVDAANGNFSVIQGSTAATMGAGATPQ